jgi:hypothetical protein
VQARATAPAPVTLLFLRDVTYAPFAPSFVPVILGAAWTTITIADVVLPAAAQYHVQIELGLAAAGTTLYFDSTRAGAAGVHWVSPCNCPASACFPRCPWARLLFGP